MGAFTAAGSVVLVSVVDMLGEGAGDDAAGLWVGAGAVEVVGEDVADEGEVLVWGAVDEVLVVGAGPAVDEVAGVEDVGVLEDAAVDVGVVDEAGLGDALAVPLVGVVEVGAVEEVGLEDVPLVGELVVALDGVVEDVDAGVDDVVAGEEPDVEVGEVEVGDVEGVGVAVGAVVPVGEVEVFDGEVAPEVGVDDWLACTP